MWVIERVVWGLGRAISLATRLGEIFNDPALSPFTVTVLQSYFRFLHNPQEELL
jgi:hypothetical protein